MTKTGAWSRARDDAGSAAVDGAAMPIALLDGSWYLRITLGGQPAGHVIRGPVRIEVSPQHLRISRDIYVAAGEMSPSDPFIAGATLFGKNWYPQLPLAQYAWHFRSVGVEYANGVLTLKFERKLCQPDDAGVRVQ